MRRPGATEDDGDTENRDDQTQADKKDPLHSIERATRSATPPGRERGSEAKSFGHKYVEQKRVGVRCIAWLGEERTELDMADFLFVDWCLL